MKRKNPPIDPSRLSAINETMDELYSNLSDIYESMADREIGEAVDHIVLMIKKLNQLKSEMRNGL